MKLVDGMMRRVFRAMRAAEIRRGCIGRNAGWIRMLGYRMTVDFADRAAWIYQFRDIFMHDCYGIRLLPDAPRVIDGGANIGMFTLYTLWRRPSARVVAVEPSRDNLALLRKNLSRVPASTVDVRAGAITRFGGQARLCGAFSDSLHIDGTRGEAVAAMSLAELLAEPTDLLKLDIEGAELEALEGAGSRLSAVRRVVLEYHNYRGRQGELPRLMLVLQDQGFDRFRVSGLKDYQWQDLDVPVHCGLLEAWRAPVPGG